METLYSTDMRRMERGGLALYDLDLDLGMLKIRQGKRKNDRMVPIGERAIEWIDALLATLEAESIAERE